jgi:transglutaminase-like putative cysteine protease
VAMNARRREVEMLLLTMFAAVPLYATQTISTLPLLLFHLVLGGIALRVARGRGPEIVPVSLVRAIAIAYVPFYLIDAALISRSAISASTHLALFISVYQPIEERSRNRHGQRLLTATMIFTASIATATHILILPFIIVFGFLMLRQLMTVSHVESVESIDIAPAELPSTRAAGFYVAATCSLAIALFPMLPRVRNPFVPGMAGALNNATTGLSDSIDFNRERSISADSSVVSRVWMTREAVPFFTPLRLRGSVYERFHNNEWRQAPRRGYVPIEMRDGYARIAGAAGFTRSATVQQRMILGPRLFLPSGTYAVNAPGQVYEGPPRDVYSIWQPLRNRDLINYEVRLARTVVPLRGGQPPRVTNYPVTPPVAAMARSIVGNDADPMSQAGSVEHYMMTRFRYVPDPASIGRAITVDEFLLHERRGHCEYFAAGMVALMTSLNVPARIVGGFYGGQLNPLTGYFVVRRQDAHAWVEVWNGRTWETFDPTPAGLRPGNAHDGLLRMYASAIGDSVNYFWDRYILTFGLADQITLFAVLISRIRGTMAALRSANTSIAAALASRELMIIAAIAVVLIAITLLIVRRRRSLFDLLAERLRLLGIEVGPSMTMAEALDELRRTRPDAAAAFAPLIALYEEEQFSAHADNGRRATLRRALTASP